MKTIGLLGGTGWSSTITYYKMLNEHIAQRLGGYHSARIILRSIDYHDIMISYGKDHEKVASLLKEELQSLIDCHPDSILICCSSLHRYYDMIKKEIGSSIPVFHAVHLVAQHLLQRKAKSVLLLATVFTMEDGFFAKILEDKGIEVIIPGSKDRLMMQKIHAELMQNIVTKEAREYFKKLIQQYTTVDAVVLGCTEYPLVVDETNSILPIIDPVVLQVKSAVDDALTGLNLT